MIPWLLGVAHAQQGRVEVIVEGLRGDRGLVHLALYASPEGFPDDVRRASRTLSVPIRAGRAEGVFDGLSGGTFAIALVHDEDSDRALDKSRMGVPVEGYGASNDPGRRLGPPRFEDAAFPVGEDPVILRLHPVYWF